MREVNEFIKPGVREHNIAVPVQHWQLRDMLKNTNDSLIFCQGNKVCRYSIQTEKVSDVLTDLSFFPTSISATEEMVIVGGQKGQYALKNIETDNTVIGRVGHAINNAVKIYDFNNEKNILFCCNDNILKRYNLETLEQVEMIPHSWPVNNCEMSPNGKHLVTVGDTSQMYFFNVEGDKLIKERALKNLNDGGFKVSWNATSTMFAVSTQDGYICIYDIRDLNKFIKIQSKQKKTIRGACRNVIFSRTRSLDLLIFTEHASFFNLVDTRNFNTKQSVKLKDDNEKQISGSAFLEDYELLFISTDDRIYEYDIENRRTFGTFLYD